MARNTVLAILMIAVMTPEAPAQIGNITRGIQRGVQNSVTRRIQTKIGEAAACTLGDKQCVDQAKARNEKVVIVDSNGTVITDERGNPVSDQDEAAALTQKPGEGVWRNYDFVPGQRVLFASDFSGERVGRFPASQLEFVSGNAQIVNLNNENVLEISANTIFRIKLPEKLSKAFSLEFDYLVPAANQAINVFFGSPQTTIARWPSHYISVYHSPGLFKAGNSVSSLSLQRVVKQMTPYKFQADGDYAILYAGTERAGNLPNAAIEPSEVVEFRASANPNLRAYLKDIVVAVGLDPLYDTLVKNGKYTTRGILFAVDDHRIRPESTPELAKFEEALKKYPNLRLLIEGHTDNTGDDRHNLELSERRAKAVVDYLVEKGIARNRFEFVGKGESDPAGSNDTPAGRAQNRRVVAQQIKP